MGKQDLGDVCVCGGGCHITFGKWGNSPAHVNKLK